MTSGLLPYLLIIYSLICVGMSVISWFALRDEDTRLNQLIFYYWLSHMGNLIVNALTSLSGNPSILLLGTAPWLYLCLMKARIMREFEPSMAPPRKRFICLSLAGYALSLGLSFFYSDLTIILIPAIYFTGILGLHICLEFYLCLRKRKRGALEYTLFWLLLSFIINMLDYPFVRPNEKLTMYGFTYFIFNVIGFAVVMPALSVKQLGKKKREDLETLVKERTEQLLQQSKLSALGEMAAGVAHEINNPLSIIVGRLEQMNRRLARHELQADFLQTSMKQIEATAYRIHRIVKGLMDFSKQGPNMPFVAQSVRDVLMEIMVFCEERFKYKKIEFILAGDLDLKVRTKGPQISQVILNLLNNAFDAIEPEKEKWIEVCSELAGDVVKISIKDSGKGIAPELRGKIMQPFFTTKEVGKGTGLGLSISKGIVEAHGGSFYLDESKSETTFVIELPRII